MLIDSGQKTIQIKLVFYGPAMSGKTTSWKYLIRLFKKNVNVESVSIDTAHSANARTLFFDFGTFKMKVGEWTIQLNVWTATGQDFYCVTRETVLQGTDGIIFVAESQKSLRPENEKSWKELQDFFRGDLEKSIPVTICLNKRDLSDIIPLGAFLNDIQMQPHTRVFETIAIDGINIQNAFLNNISQILERNKNLIKIKDLIFSLP
ncbi:MAG: GTP-binding protein, partial [Candidatus Helarchaeota archaeon]